MSALKAQEAVDILQSKGSWLPVYLPLDGPSPALLPGDVVAGTVTRTLSANGLNPDFHIAGSFRRGDRELGRFACRACAKECRAMAIRAMAA